MDAIVMAAGEGTRLRPLTERWPKPVLPIDGRPVVAVLLHELAAAGCARVWLVTGHLAEHVEGLVGDGSAFGVDVRRVRQPEALGSADDTLFGTGDVARFARVFGASGAAGAVAVRTDPGPGPDRRAIRRSGDRVVQMRDDDAINPWTPAPLWGLDRAVADRLCLDR